jgi:hypothetical protein
VSLDDDVQLVDYDEDLIYEDQIFVQTDEVFTLIHRFKGKMEDLERGSNEVESSLRQVESTQVKDDHG